MKEKFHDATTSIEARLAKVELTMADAQGMNLIEQSIEKGFEGFKGTNPRPQRRRANFTSSTNITQ